MRGYLILSSLLLLRLIEAFLILLSDLVGHVSSYGTVTDVFHGEFAFALRIRADVCRETEHVVQWNLEE